MPRYAENSTLQQCPEGEYPYKDIFGISRCGRRLISDGLGTVGDDPTDSGEKAAKVIEAIGDYTSGKVVDDYISENIIIPLLDTAVKFALMYAGLIFIVVGLLLIALNTTIGKKAASVATRGVSNVVTES